MSAFVPARALRRRPLSSHARTRAPLTRPPAQAKAGKKGAAHAPSNTWDWEFQRERILRPLAGALEADLLVLFRGRPVEEPFLSLFVAALSAVAESAQALKNKAVRSAISDMVGSVAVRCAAAAPPTTPPSPHLPPRHGQVVIVSTALLHLLNKHEHLPARPPRAPRRRRRRR